MKPTLYSIKGLSFALVILLGVSCTGPVQNIKDTARPNIILIMVDDMGWSDIGSYGSEIQTPNLDKMAQGGMRFAQFYNNAKCTTTRASLLTGLYPRRDQGDEGLLRTNMVTLGEVLKSGGYQTAMVGKWHLGRDKDTHPYHRGFDAYYGLLDGAANHFDPTLADPKYKGGKVRYFGNNDERITEFPEGFYSTDAYTDHSIKMLEQFKKSEAPFFLHITYTAPHYPLHAKPEDIAKYKGKYGMGWEALRKQRYARQLGMGLIDSVTYKLSGTDSQAYPWETAQHEFEDLRMAVYAAMVDAVDQNIGKLMASLKELGYADNTLVLFLSDNGGCSEEPGGRDPKERNPGPKDDYVAVGPAWGWAQNAPFRRYKVWMHEGGIRTPLIAWWPGHIPADTITREPGHIIDLMPTLAEVAQVSYPKDYNGNPILPMEGNSLLPVFQGGKNAKHDALYWEYAGNRAMRKGEWKLVWDKLKKEWELYNLHTDQTEVDNLAARYPERVMTMRKQWESWAAQTGLKVP